MYGFTIYQRYNDIIEMFKTGNYEVSYVGKKLGINRGTIYNMVSELIKHNILKVISYSNITTIDNKLHKVRVIGIV